MASSSDVTAGSAATAAQYNNLRADVLNTTTGHLHNGTDARSHLGTATPLIESGTGAVGSSSLFARQDHVHPAPGAGTASCFAGADQTMTNANTWYFPGVQLDNLAVGTWLITASVLVYAANASLFKMTAVIGNLNAATVYCAGEAWVSSVNGPASIPLTCLVTGDGTTDFYIYVKSNTATDGRILHECSTNSPGHYATYMYAVRVA
jgi:hypothetical protein